MAMERAGRIIQLITHSRIVPPFLQVTKLGSEKLLKLSQVTES